MENLENILKSSVPVEIMSIYCRERAQSAKFLYEDGLVHYNGEMLEPEVVFRRYIAETPLLTVVGGNVSRRHIEEYNGKSYRWETLMTLRR
jgi:hypothetical protein